MATVRMYRGHWVADYYDVNQRRRIERPEGRFKRAREELQAAQILLADRVAEVADASGDRLASWAFETKWKLLRICQVGSSGRAQKT